MHKSFSTLGILVFGLVCLVGPVAAAETVEAVSSGDFPDAQQPQLAVSLSGKGYLVFGAGNVVYCTTSEDGGKSYDKPVKVGEAGALALGMRRGPRVAATDKAVVVTAIGGRLGRGRDEDLLTWRSTDGGKSWSGPVTINSVPSSAREGLHHTTAAPDGTVFGVWLDLRAKKMEVYGAASKDGGATWQGETLIYRSPDGSVCECCQPQAAYDSRGRLYVMWRNQLSGARDMYLAQSDDNGRTFSKAAKLGDGTWPLKACPMDGGGLAAGNGKVLTVWMRKKEVFRCSPEEREFRDSAPTEVSLGKGEQPWAAAGPDGTYLVWIGSRPGSVFALTPGSRQPIKLSDRGSDPVAAGPVSGKGPVLVAWEEGESKARRIKAAVLTPGR